MNQNEKAIAVVDRIYNRCEEIDNDDGYSMLDDIWALKDYIRKKSKPVEWELVYHDDNPFYYAKHVTARCSRCKHWYRSDGEDYGKRLASVFVTNYSKKYRFTVAHMLMDEAEKEINKLPHFCENCGARLKGSRRDYESYRD